MKQPEGKDDRGPALADTNIVSKSGVESSLGGLRYPDPWMLRSLRERGVYLQVL
jgi:hypothetical protein